MILLGIISDERAFRSKSPAMHDHVLARLGLAGVYLPLAVTHDRLGPAVAGIAALGFAGVNVTVPFKERVGTFLDEVAPSAAGIGAVNTIVNDHGRLIGHNTDAPGLTAALEALGFTTRDAVVLVIGAGGAARAALYTARQGGAARVILAGRNREKTALTALEMGAEPWDLADLAQAPLAADLIINATSVSAPPEAPELADLARTWPLTGCRLVFDLNYGRTTNIWADLAQRLEAGFTDGLPLLAHQARFSFNLWTGLTPEVDLFLEGLKVKG